MKRMNKRGNGFMVVGIIVVILIGIVAVMAIFGIGTFGDKLSSQQQAAIEGQVVEQIAAKDTCSQNPAYTYSAIDKFSNTIITGTDQIRLNSLKPVTSLASPTVGEDIVYWKENNTIFCNLEDESPVLCGSQLVQTTCFQNVTSLTTKVFNRDDNTFLAEAGATLSSTSETNLTLGVKGIANLELRYQGIADRSGMPFGGCVAIEYPNTITKITVTGSQGDMIPAAVLDTPCTDFTYTYSNQGTGTTVRQIRIPDGWDSKGFGDLKILNFQVEAGSDDPSGTIFVEWMPANYYVTNDGPFDLNIDKVLNRETSKTMGAVGNFNFIVE